MMSLLFLLFLAVMILTLADRGKPSIILFCIALVLSTAWFLHHASSTLAVQL